VYEPEIHKLIACLEDLSKELSPKATLEQVILYLLVCEKEEYPLIELSERMDWNTLKTSRQVNTLADRQYSGGTYSEGYEVLYTQEDRDNRILKNAFLTHKGKELKSRLIEILKEKAAKPR
jgi:hypothetical protein